MNQIQKYIRAKKTFSIYYKKYPKHQLDNIKHNFAYEYSNFIGLNSIHKFFSLLYYLIFIIIYNIRERIGKFKEKPAKKKQILFFVNSISHAKIAIPLHKELNSHIIANGYSTKKFLTKNKIKFQSLNQFSGKKPKIKLSLKPKQIILHRLLSQEKLLSESIEKCLNILNPSKVILFNEVDMFGKLLVFHAKVKTIYIQHGIVSDHPSYEKMNSNLILVWGDLTKDYLVKFGVNPTKIIVTGNLLFDKLTSHINIRKKFNITEKTIMTYTSQGPGFEISKEMNRKIFENLLRITDDNIRIIIKLHPAEHLFLNGFSLIKYLMAKLKGSKIIITKKINSVDLIKDSDVLITQISTTGAEAILLDKKVISINLSGKPSIASFVIEKAAYEISNEKDIQKIPSILKSKKWDKINKRAQTFKFKYNYKNDGNAKKRIINLIK